MEVMTEGRGGGGEDRGGDGTGRTGDGEYREKNPGDEENERSRGKGKTDIIGSGSSGRIDPQNIDLKDNYFIALSRL